MQIIRTIFFLISISFSSLLVAQNNADDSLQKELNGMPLDTNRVNILLELSKSLYAVNQTKAIDFAKEAQILASELNYKNAEALALKYIGLANYYQGNYVEVILNWEQALDIFQEINDKPGIANMLSNLGAVYNNQGDDAKALSLYSKSLELAEEINDTIRKIMTLNNMGLIYSKSTESADVALDHYQQALGLSKLVKDDYGIGTASLNIGELLFERENHSDAIKHLKIAFEAYSNIGSVHVSDALNYIGKVYFIQGNYKMAIEYQEQSFAIAQEMGAQLEMAKALLGLADSYAKMDKHKQAVKYYLQAKEIGTNLGALYIEFDALQGLGEGYAKLSNHKKAYKYTSQAMVLKDTLLSERNLEQINSIRVKYETESTLKENEILKKDIELSAVKSNKQRTVIFFLILGFVVTSLLIGMLFSANKQKKQANSVLEGKNKLISSQKKEILDSIIYAKRIQFSALPSIDEINKHVSDSFVLFKPKDVVSGDYYWYSVVENQLVITAADCTGHGVPGGFMSMLGMSFLKLIVEKEYITQPDIILRKLRKEVVKALGQKGKSGEQKDGMDMTLCSINLETLELQWAGANNPCLLVQDGVFSEIKPDKMPIAIYEKMDKYTLHTRQLKKGDIIYLITDGYPDQFGGPKDRKFMSKILKKLLLEISSESMTEQHNILETAIDSWMNDHGKYYKQTDDITILGIKI